MASSKWLVASGLILLIGTQTVFAKKDTAAVIFKKEAKKIAAKDTVTVAEDTTVVIIKNKAVKNAKKVVEKDESAIKVSGTLEAGFDNNYRANNKETIKYNRIGKAEVDFSVRPTKKVRAELGFEYNRNHKDTSFTIDKLYGQYNIANFSLVRFGYIKKSFGLEERTGLDNRYFHKRSIINDSLEYFGFLGHDLTLQYRHELGKRLELRGGFSWTEDSTRYLQNYSVEYNDKKKQFALSRHNISLSAIRRR